MKKLFGAAFLLVLLGAGCAGNGGSTASVEGKWQLAFDLPQGWVMAKAYDENSLHDLSQDVKHTETDVILQNTDKKICLAGDATCAADSAKIADGAVMIEATKLDSHRVLPSDREVLGDRFSRIKLCDDGGDCTKGGKGNYDYFLETDDGNYKFSYYGDSNAAKNVITSAKVVTKYTDGAPVSVPEVETK